MNTDTAYTVDGYRGMAWHYIGPETRADEETEWTGIEPETGNVRMVMVGDDRVFTFEPGECHSIPDEEYCGGCGQVGCRAYA